LQREIVISSMNKLSPTVLVDPRFAIEWRDIEDFLAEFGPFNGRYVPRYPNDWILQIKRHIDELSLDTLGPIKKQTILERIRRELPLCSIPGSWSYVDCLSWSTNVHKAFDKLERLIVVGNALEPEPFLSWVDAIEVIRQTRKRSWPFHGSISEYLDFCRPLLLCSPAAYFIDCYLDPFSTVAENFIRSLFSVVKGSRCYSIELIIRRSAISLTKKRSDFMQLSDSDLQLEFERIYSGIVPKDRSLKIHIVTEGKLGGNALRLHDRFFLTTHGSINFGQGFLFIDQKAPQLNAYVVDSSHHKVLKHTFIDGVARHAEKLSKISGIPYPIAVTSICL
jgi:hypothetical protein